MLVILIKVYGELKSMFSELNINKENITLFLDCARMVKKAGGLKNLHEFLTEAEKHGLLGDIDSLIE